MPDALTSSRKPIPRNCQWFRFVLLGRRPSPWFQSAPHSRPGHFLSPVQGRRRFRIVSFPASTGSDPARNKQRKKTNPTKIVETLKKAQVRSWLRSKKHNGHDDFKVPMRRIGLNTGSKTPRRSHKLEHGWEGVKFGDQATLTVSLPYMVLLSPRSGPPVWPARAGSKRPSMRSFRVSVPGVRQSSPTRPPRVRFRRTHAVVSKPGASAPSSNHRGKQTPSFPWRLSIPDAARDPSAMLCWG